MLIRSQPCIRRLLCFAVFAVATVALHAARPNVLFIIADDLGWADVGWHGSEIQTPNLDALAKAGVRLERHHVMATCSPTRAGFLSGRYPSRFGCVSPTNNRVFTDDTPTLAKVFRTNGYFTGITGKWHLGSKPEWGPLQHGFTASYGALAGGVDQYGHWYKDGVFRNTWHRNDHLVAEEGHATDLFAREARRWMEEHRAQPWFIAVTFTAPHIPLQEPREWLKRYDRKINDPARKLFAAAVTHLDHAVGELVRTIEATGQRERTLIVFTSDNGAQENWLGTGEYEGGHLPCPSLGNNTPLRQWKGSLFEGGIRVPAFVNWPGRLPPGESHAPMHIVDWFPTLLAATGVKTAQPPKYDGLNLWPGLTGAKPAETHRTLYWRTPGAVAVRHGDHKLVVQKNSRLLFNVTTDPEEKEDLAAKQPELVKELLERLAHLQRDDAGKPLAFN